MSTLAVCISTLLTSQFALSCDDEAIPEFQTYIDHPKRQPASCEVLFVSVPNTLGDEILDGVSLEYGSPPAISLEIGGTIFLEAVEDDEKKKYPNHTTYSLCMTKEHQRESILRVSYRRQFSSEEQPGFSLCRTAKFIFLKDLVGNT